MIFGEQGLRRKLELGAYGVGILLCVAPAGAAPKTANAANESLGAASVTAGADRAKSQRRSCRATYESARESQRALRWREAKDRFSSCADAPCAADVRQRCATEYSQLVADIPSIVATATDETGTPRLDVQLKVDGELLTSKLDGRALAVEPGMHEFAFSAADGRVANQRLLVLQGQHNLVVSVTLHPQAAAAESAHATVVAPPASPPAVSAAPPTTPSAEMPVTKADASPSTGPVAAPSDTAQRAVASVANPSAAASVDRAESKRGVALPIVLGGAGLIATGAGALMVGWAGKDNTALGRCSPNCKQSSVDHVRNLYIAGDISLALGVSAVGAAVYFYLTSGGKEAAPRALADYKLDLRPTQGGGFASISGAL